MLYPHLSLLLRPALVLGLCAAGPAHADLLGPERFVPAADAPIGELRWSMQAPGDHRVQLGATLRRPGGDAPLDPHGQGWQLGLWAQDEWRVTDGMVATGGVHLGRDDAGLRSASPRAGVRWQALDGLQLRAEVERTPGTATGIDADGLLTATSGTADLARLVGEQRLPGDWQLRATAGRARPVDGTSGRQGTALAVGRTWPGGLRVQAGLAVQENDADGPSTRLALDAPVGALLLGARWMAGSGANRVDLRLQSTRWWVDVAGLGAAAPADHRQVRLGANLPF
jgi:hypothetical protein